MGGKGDRAGEFRSREDGALVGGRGKEEDKEGGIRRSRKGRGGVESVEEG